MNNAPMVFAFDSHAVRVVYGKDKEPWFVAADICSVLELETHVALRRLDDDEKGRYSIPTPGGDQDMTVVTESGLYNLILGSRKPEAKHFKKWVTSDVLPSIRRTGNYGKGASISQQLSAHGFRLRLLDAIERERNTEKRIAIQQQLEHVSGMLGLPTPAYGSIGHEAPSQPPALETFWAALNKLASLGERLNHSKNSTLLAINIPHVMDLLEKHGISVAPRMELLSAIKLSTTPKFERRGIVKSAIADNSVHCWIFKAEGPTTLL